jgi:ElaB/YqjD/DUF883 family membrane-anchored ribosome-binding protein
MTTPSLSRDLDPRALPSEEPDPFESLRERATELEKNTRTFIQANPTVALVGALTIGFLVGRLVMR